MNHLPFLAYKYKTSIICCGIPCNKDEQRAICTTTFSWYHKELQKVNTYTNEGFALHPLGVPYIVHHDDHFQFIKARKTRNQVFKKSSTEGDELSTNPLNIKKL